MDRAARVGPVTGSIFNIRLTNYGGERSSRAKESGFERADILIEKTLLNRRTNYWIYMV